MSETPTMAWLGWLLLRRWWVLAIGGMLGAALGFGAVQLVQPEYSATATQLVKGVPGTGPGASFQAAQFAVSRARSYPAFLYSNVVLEGVRDDIGGAQTLDQLRADLSADNPLDTPLVRVTAVGTTPELAQDKANSAARHLARYITQIETVGSESPVTVEIGVLAGRPTSPSSPKPLLFVAMGGSLGLAIAAALALFVPAPSPDEDTDDDTADEAVVGGTPSTPAEGKSPAEPGSASEPAPEGADDAESEPQGDPEDDLGESEKPEGELEAAEPKRSAR